MRRISLFCLLISFPLLGQEIPKATGLPDFPFSIKNTWLIGGTGSWDYLALDPKAKLLYIAHSSVVQVVDTGSGSLIGEIQGFREAHAIALDDTGAYGYVSDGPAGEVKAFNRRTLVVEATIPVSCSPRSVTFEPQTRLVFAVCSASTLAPAAPSRPIRRPSQQPNQPPATGSPGMRSNGISQQTVVPEAVSGISHVIAIDAESRSVLADIALAGDYRFADADGQGQVYVSVGAIDSTYVMNGHSVRTRFPQQIAKIDAQAIVTQAQSHQAEQSPSAGGNAPPLRQPLHIDWNPTANVSSLVSFLPLDASCANPQGLAVDGSHQRVFAACDDQRFEVLDGARGNVVASLTTGPGDDVIGYDPDRGLIFIANGDGYGSLTIVRQDATTDEYQVIQNLPTRERTRTLAVDSTRSLVYMVTDYHGVDLTQQGGIGSLKSIPLAGSFQVVVVGH